MEDTYKIVRYYSNSKYWHRVLKTGLQLEEAIAHCRDPESSSATCTKYSNRIRTKKVGMWFDAYRLEDKEEVTG